MHTIEKLNHLCGKSHYILTRDRRRLYIQLAAEISSLLLSTKEKDRGKLSLAVRKTVEHLRVLHLRLDAIGHLLEHVIGPNNAYELPVPRGFASANNFLQDELSNGGYPNRGFVYIARRKRPEEFFYVGKAGSVSRLRLHAHGPLAYSLNKCSHLTVIYPLQSRDNTLLKIEASTIAILTHSNLAPTYNTKSCRIPPGRHSNEWLDISKKLCKSLLS